MSNELMSQEKETGTLNCSIVRDLLPNYVEHLTSDETNAMIENHLNECVECSSLKNAMLSEIRTEKVPVDPDVKRIMVRTRNRMLLNGIFLWAGILAVLVCTIVDLAVSHGLTWSLIVDGGVAYGYLIISTLVRSREHRFVKTFAVITVGLLPYQYLIQQVVNATYAKHPENWFASYALPISVVWIAILWINVGIKKVFRLNLWQMLGVFFLISLAGTAVTDMVAMQLSFKEAYFENYQWITDIGTIVVCIILMIVGHLRKGKEKRFER